MRVGYYFEWRSSTFWKGDELVRLQRIKNRVAVIAVVAGLAITGSVMAAPSASATDPAAAPPGYGGPVSNCPGSRVTDFYLLSSSGAWRSGVLEVWYSSGSSGTYCAFTRDNIAGSHHMEVVIRRGDWTTNWYDSGTYNYYAGGVEVFGAAAKTVYLFGRVTVDGVNYEARVRCDPTASCYRIDGW
jgi:hypothetical protein